MSLQIEKLDLEVLLGLLGLFSVCISFALFIAPILVLLDFVWHEVVEHIKYGKQEKIIIPEDPYDLAEDPSTEPNAYFPLEAALDSPSDLR